MNKQTKVIVGVALLIVSAVVLFWSVANANSTLILAIAAVAALGLAAGSLLIGSTGTTGRTV